ncbi:TetR/AcrR family transcriptional regulator [Clostridioides sp. ES-S-0049-02]|uniref:TetR/AcrR family transcriptional regulator n=1 Tax=unclassified Clostridioides TaxID=2635829 RepID=UPI001D0C3B32|nr:TetR/AcrR family transcriptional regulator [Clostridioides sp. ES-S-0049-02]MCC0764090.1 TetR/AcrR family transcriptional regulator [Clostridioides sp. ES-S-0006-03]
MPKVNEQYLEEKRDQILDAAFDVCMSKPVYTVKMKDIIEKTGFSHGLVYRYFTNLEDILFALINRDTSIVDVSAKVDEILHSEHSPEDVVKQLFSLYFDAIMIGITGYGKILNEMLSTLASDQQYYQRFRANVKVASHSDYLQTQAYQYIEEQIQKGYFSPKQTLDEIYSFITVCLSGIERDLILTRCYPAMQYIQLNTDGLLFSLCTSVLFMLGSSNQSV